MSPALILIAALAAAAPASNDALLKKGVELRKKGKDAEALEVFKQAYAKSATPRALAQMGLAEQALSSWIDAETHVESALAAKDDDWIREHRATLEGALAKIREHVGTIVVRANVEGAKAQIDGVDRELGAEIRHAEGPATVVITAPDHERFEQQLAVRGGERADVDAKLTPIANVKAQPPPPPPPIVVEKSAPPPRTSLAPYAYLAAGSAALATGAGVVFLINRAAHVDKYNDNAQCLPPNGLTREQNCGEEREAASSAQLLATIGFIAGGVLGLTGAALFILDDVALRPGPGDAGAAIAIELD